MSTISQRWVSVALGVGLALSWMNACGGSEFGSVGGDGGGPDGDGGDESTGGSRDPSKGTGGDHGGDGTGDSGSENGGNGSGGEDGPGGASGGGPSNQGGASGGGTSNRGGASGGGHSNQGGAGTGQGGTSSGSGGTLGISGGTLGTSGGPSLCSARAKFCDDFEDGDTVGWLLFDGSWSVVTDGTKVFEQASLDSGSATVDAAWGAQDINVRVKLGEAPGQLSSYYAFVAGRYQDFDNYYFVTIRADNKLGLGKRYQGNVTDLITPVNVSPAEWHSVRLLIVESTLVVYLDGAQRASAIDSALTTGGIALGSNGIAASFDDVLVLLP